MASPKKKLPTGPIRIENPLTKHSETFSPSTERQQTNESSLIESNLQDFRKQDSSLKDTLFDSSQDGSVKDAVEYEIQFYKEIPEASPENLKQESSKQDYKKLDSSFNETKNNLEPSSIAKEVRQQSPDTKQESIKLEDRIQEVEYKKVAMRLSAEAVNRLRELRTVTELPYEVLVDVMIRNWDNLPAKIQKQYLSEAKQVRIQRLIAGQDKAMTTVRKRLND